MKGLHILNSCFTMFTMLYIHLNSSNIAKALYLQPGLARYTIAGLYKPVNSHVQTFFKIQ